MRIICIISLLLFFSCKDHIDSGSVTKAPLATRAEVAGNLPESKLSSAKNCSYNKTIRGIAYSFQFFEAVEYLGKIGRQPAAEDLKALEKETVAVISFTDQSTGNILEKSAFSSDDSQMYLSGNIVKDLTIEQKDSEIEITGCQILANGTRNDRLGVIIFIKGLNIHEKFKALFYDQLFNGGLIRIPSLKHASK